jgi:GNAT superfamily N-acetyltransferase
MKTGLGKKWRGRESKSVSRNICIFLQIRYSLAPFLTYTYLSMGKRRLDIADLVAQSLARPELGDAVIALESAERAEQETIALLKRIVRGARLGVEDIAIEDVLDPDRGPELDAWHNHPGVNSGPRAVAVALARNHALATQFAESVNKSGAFYQQYVDETRPRIADGMHTRTDGGGWKVFVGSGRIRSTEEPYDLGPRNNAAHGDFLFPPDTTLEEPVVPVPTGKHDVVFPSSKHILEEILHDPACAFLIADICAYPHARGAGIASKVEDRAFQLAQQLNTGTASLAHKLKYAVSAMANVVSVENEAGEVVWTFNPPALNLISLVMHTRRSARPGFIIGEQRHQKIADVAVEGKKYVIKGDWVLAAQRLDTTPNAVSASVPDTVLGMGDKDNAPVV